ncbi:hypothetical protein ACWD5R_44295, partial [Streptomyces sp. NPDC002514]
IVNSAVPRWAAMNLLAPTYEMSARIAAKLDQDGLRQLRLPAGHFTPRLGLLRKEQPVLLPVVRSGPQYPCELPRPPAHQRAGFIQLSCHLRDTPRGTKIAVHSERRESLHGLMVLALPGIDKAPDNHRSAFLLPLCRRCQPP